MPSRLERRHGVEDFHFITCSCYQRRPLLNNDEIKKVFLEVLEETRAHYRFCVFGYVLMPEHFHLLLNEPKISSLSTVLQVLKQRVSREVHVKGLYRGSHPFWQTRYYDFNVWSRKKHIEKLRYLHRNPVNRGLVVKPEDWPWSSFRHYATAEIGTVEIESEWTGRRRERELNLLVPMEWRS